MRTKIRWILPLAAVLLLAGAAGAQAQNRSFTGGNWPTPAQGPLQFVPGIGYVPQNVSTYGAFAGAFPASGYRPFGPSWYQRNTNVPTRTLRRLPASQTRTTRPANGR